MNKYLEPVSAIITFLLLNTACTTTIKSGDSPKFQETLFVFEDGRMKLNSRYVDSKDVVIYSDGRGGEKAAVKVRVPLHAAFYRDSIIVNRIVNDFDEAIGRHEMEDVNNIN